MPSRYRRPIHENEAVESTFYNHVERTLNWRIDYNRTTRMFILTDKQGHEMAVPQGMGVNAGAILKKHLSEHGGH